MRDGAGSRVRGTRFAGACALAGLLVVSATTVHADGGFSPLGPGDRDRGARAMVSFTIPFGGPAGTTPEKPHASLSLHGPQPAEWAREATALPALMELRLDEAGVRSVQLGGAAMAERRTVLDANGETTTQLLGVDWQWWAIGGAAAAAGGYAAYELSDDDDDHEGSGDLVAGDGNGSSGGGGETGSF